MTETMLDVLVSLFTVGLQSFKHRNKSECVFEDLLRPPRENVALG